MVDEEGNFGFLAALIFYFAVVVAVVSVEVFVWVEKEANCIDRHYYKDGDEVFNGKTPTPKKLKNGKNFEFLIVKDDNNNFNKNNIIIKNSSTYSISELDEMIDIIMIEADNGELINKRKVLNELKWHKVAYNVGYKPKQTATADVYFNHDDEGHGFLSWLMNNIYI